jgi:alkylation response protein AidB-like acyl-CoA dehydrogenase
VQALFAQASAALAAARALLLAEIDAAWAMAQSVDAMPLDMRARVRLAATHMTRTAADVVRQLQDMAGGASVFLEDPLNRRLADAQTMTAHIMTAPATYELAGRALLGVPVSTAEL